MLLMFYNMQSIVEPCVPKIRCFISNHSKDLLFFNINILKNSFDQRFLFCDFKSRYVITRHSNFFIRENFKGSDIPNQRTSGYMYKRKNPAPTPTQNTAHLTGRLFYDDVQKRTLYEHIKCNMIAYYGPPFVNTLST